VRTVAALYIDPRGPYPRIADVDCWDEARNAKLYAGPHPIVAHPDCRTWSRARHMNKHGDAECGIRAVDQVKLWGGVLEQPAGSLLWRHCRLPTPISASPLRRSAWQDMFRGFAVEVEQVSWGHVARKPTWLYFVGIDPHTVFQTLRTGGTPTHWCSGRRYGGNPARAADAVPPGIKVCSAQLRRRTPPAFAEWLVALARTSKVHP
jgi:hypothetical protein